MSGYSAAMSSFHFSVTGAWRRSAWGRQGFLYRTPQNRHVWEWLLIQVVTGPLGTGRPGVEARLCQGVAWQDGAGGSAPACGRVASCLGAGENVRFRDGGAVFDSVDPLTGGQDRGEARLQNHEHGGVQLFGAK